MSGALLRMDLGKQAPPIEKSYFELMWLASSPSCRTALGLDEVGFPRAGRAAQGEDVVDPRHPGAVPASRRGHRRSPTPAQMGHHLEPDFVLSSRDVHRPSQVRPLGPCRVTETKSSSSSASCRAVSKSWARPSSVFGEELPKRGVSPPIIWPMRIPESLNDRRARSGRALARSRPARRCGEDLGSSQASGFSTYSTSRLDPVRPGMPARPEPGAQPVIQGRTSYPAMLMRRVIGDPGPGSSGADRPEPSRPPDVHGLGSSSGFRRSQRPTGHPRVPRRPRCQPDRIEPGSWSLSFKHLELFTVKADPDLTVDRAAPLPRGGSGSRRDHEARAVITSTSAVTQFFDPGSAATPVRPACSRCLAVPRAAGGPPSGPEAERDQKGHLEVVATDAERQDRDQRPKSPGHEQQLKQHGQPVKPAVAEQAGLVRKAIR